MSAFSVAYFLQHPGPGRSLLEFAKLDTIFGQGDSGDAMFHVVTGAVKLTVVSREGKEPVLATVGQGELFGEGCLVPGQARTHSAIATMPSIVMRLDSEMLLETAAREPALMEAILSHVLHRTTRVEQDFVDAGHVTL